MTLTSLPTSPETFRNAEIVASNATAASTKTNHAPTFNVIGDGKLTITLPGQATSLALQDDGRIVVTGDVAGNGFSLARINVDGTFDTTFSGDGKQIVQVGSSGTYGHSLVIQDDGKILTAGFSNYPALVALTRFTADGALDSSFSADGKLTTNLGLSGTSLANDLALQADGKILVAGTSASLQGRSDFALARYDGQGNLDNSFSGDGKLTTDFATNNDQCQSVAIQRDGKIVLAGTVDTGGATGYDFALARYNSNGTLDTTFGGYGKMTLDFGYTNDLGRDMLIQPDDKILVVGQSYGSGQLKIVLARFNSNGTLDASFSDDGRVTTQLGPYNNPSMTPNVEKFSVALQRDGKILVAGFSYDNNPDGKLEFVLVRYNQDGTLDNTFSGDGILSTTFDGYMMAAGSSVAVQSNGQILVGGLVHDGMQFSLGVVRYNEDGSLDSNFGIHNNLGSNPDYVEDGDPVILDSTVKISDTELDARGNYAGAVVSLSRQGGANPSDTFSGSGNLLLVGGSTVLSGSTIGSLVNAGGILTITFNSNATQADVDETLSSIAYANSSNSPPGFVQIDWVFNDGNVGGQDVADALSGFGSTVVSITAVNDIPTGSVTISGTATQGQIVSAANTLVDLDGLGDISYQWLANGINISGATASTLTLTQAHVGKSILVTASFTDEFGQVESMSSIATASVANINDLPIGAVSIIGMSTQGQTLTASNSLADLDGLGAISYQWKAGGANISGATASTYTLTQFEVGKPITVVGSYTDDGNTAETVSSSATSVVANVNDAPTGSVTITGVAKVGKILIASNSLTDADGLGTVSYQWKSAGESIGGATGSTYQLKPSDVGKTISVVASYTDGFGQTEQVTSGATNTVSNIEIANLAGQVYEWKSHALLSDVGVKLKQTSSVAGTTTPLFELKGLALNAQGDASAELWVNFKEASGSLDLTLQFDKAIAGSFVESTGALPSGWTLIPGGDAGSLTLGGMGLTDASGSVKLGVVNFDLPTGVSSAQIKLVDGSTGASSLTPYAVSVGGSGLSATTGADGKYGFELLDAGSYQLDVSKALTTAETGSVINSADALAALKIAVGRNPNADPDGAGPLLAPAVSPYQFIAADANQDGKITSADALAILKMAVKRTDAPAKEWLFVNENQDFWNETTNSFTTTKASVLWDKALQVSSPLTTQQNVVAVLKGDVNGSWTPPTGAQDLDITSPAYFTELAAKLGTPANQWAVIG